MRSAKKTAKKAAKKAKPAVKTAAFGAAKPLVNKVRGRIKPAVIKTAKQLAHAAKHEDYHHDAQVLGRQSKAVGKGLLFASTAAGAVGQPELAAPLAALGGGTLAVSAGAHQVASSGLLKKKKRTRVGK